MRTGLSFISPPAGAPATASNLQALVVASFCRIGSVVGFAGTYIVPAGYVRPLTVIAAFSQ